MQLGFSQPLQVLKHLIVNNPAIGIRVNADNSCFAVMTTGVCLGYKYDFAKMTEIKTFITYEMLHDSQVEISDELKEMVINEWRTFNKRYLGKNEAAYV